MASVCFYFQMHQPRRLRRYSVFDTEPNYFDDARNRQILLKVADKCYRPATRLLLDLVEKHGGKFRVAFSLTGCVVEQLQADCPDVIDMLTALAKTGCVEFLSESYHHNLAFLYSHDEFREQVTLHREMIEGLFAQTPQVFRYTELIYSNEVARAVDALGGYKGMLAEGVDKLLNGRSPSQVYHPPGHDGLAVLLKDYKLSDDIAFRFSDQQSKDWPLTPEKFVKGIREHTRVTTEGCGTTGGGETSGGGVCNLFLDYETFGEHQWADTGIFKFLEGLPACVLADGDLDFKTPSESIDAYPPTDEYDAPHLTSWADTERDLSAWLGNAMQSNALHEFYKLERGIKSHRDTTLLADWRHLGTSDHFYYMCTKYFADGDVHKYFNPYESPYDSYINFMNALDNLRQRVEGPVA